MDPFPYEIPLGFPVENERSKTCSWKQELHIVGAAVTEIPRGRFDWKALTPLGKAGTLININWDSKPKTRKKERSRKNYCRQACVRSHFLTLAQNSNGSIFSRGVLS